ncbi:MAG: hypothetical protein ABJZ55_20165 [Fuerstiella sp.]
MNLLEVESRLRLPVGAILLAFVGLGLAGLSIATNEIKFAAMGFPFLTTAASLFLFRSKAFHADFTEDAIVLKKTDQEIPYESMSFLDFASKIDKNGDYVSDSAEITVTHDAGEFVIPAKLNHSSVDVYEFLFERSIPREDFPLDPILEDFVNEQEELFGPEKVFHFCARRNANIKKAGRRVMTKIAAGLALGALGLGATGGVLKNEDWVVAAVSLGAAAFLFFLMGMARRQTAGSRLKNWDLAGVVVSPVGVAMIQGSLKGKMEWDEIRAVSFGIATKNYEFAVTRGAPGILLKFDGGALTIVDVYNQPLPYLFAVIQDYWQEGGDA